MIGRVALLSALLAGAAVPALAQEMGAPAPARQATQAAPAASAPVPDEMMGDEEDIVVTGQRERGAVIGDIPAEVQLSPAEIRSYGVNSVAELLTELAPQISTNQGRDRGASVVLLNGLKISGFSEIRDLPTEAIQRVDILPEEVALKYGYKAEQKVVNIVLRRRFRATTVELSDRLATGGGANNPEIEANLLRITPDGRFSLNGEYERNNQLLESRRDILAGTGLDQRPFRTLMPSSDEASLNAVYARGIAEGVSATINGRIERDDSRALLGLSADGNGPLITQNNDSLNTRLATTINGAISGWQWTFTGAFDRTETDTKTSVTADTAHSTASMVGGDFTINGQPLTLPAGPVSATLRLNSSTSDFSSRSTRGGTFRSGDVHRDIGGGQVNVDLPVASRNRDVLGFLGKLSLNGNFEAERLSDFGTLYTYGFGTTWSPFKALDVVASWSDEDGPPSAQQLGNPVIVTPGVRVFDLVRGESAIVTQITGGNPNLLADNRRVMKIGMTLRPFGETDLRLTANYTRARTRNAIESLSSPTAAIEAAFPDSFMRKDGNLVAIDARPVNFFRERSDQLRWGVNFSKRIKDSTAEQFRALAAAGRLPFPGRGQGGQGGQGAQGGGSAGPGGQQPGAGGRRFGGGGGGFGGGRLQFALYHTWHFKDDVLVRPGGPFIDLLEGGSTGRGGGQPRHEIEAQAGITRNGLGARLSANWQSGTTVLGASGSPADDLRFGSLATVNFRLFANLGGMPKVIADHPWLRGSRVTVSINNLFNERQRVRDATGATPVNYQPDLLDPLGRTIRISFRKLFYSIPQRVAPRPGDDD
ncbi:TonB-dependent receptor [Sphingomonas sp. MAH-20]|uniref:TonB-dependent receptor n=1 Tax=Sphingomonas horti TaxID=2682842 RepID=A0A6I4J1B6_9SPHN|nr:MULTISPECIES: TonB-dependent receptor [Sphingomonas]MBA2920002.1 TonB-dependent receptor [Sphingomonas sp. CGMCC 1.13658]MVO77883.1 TonB-dependent receptor [Sphingomonas horti]